MTWSKKPSRRSGAPPRPGGSATEKSSSPISKKRSGSGLGNPDSTPSNRRSVRPPRSCSEKGSEKGCVFHDDGQRRSEDDQGPRREIRRFPIHGPARQVAARHL